MNEPTKISVIGIKNDHLVLDINGNPDVMIPIGTTTVTHDGRAVILTEPIRSSALYMRNVERYDAYKGTDFVILNMDDAKNILDMLNEAISSLRSGSREDDDVEVFGDKAISYERLIDRLDGLVYPVDRIFRDQEKEFADGYDFNGNKKIDLCVDSGCNQERKIVNSHQMDDTE